MLTRNDWFFILLNMAKKPFHVSLKEIRKECKIRVPYTILKDIERIINNGGYKYLNDFVVDAMKEKIKKNER